MVGIFPTSFIWERLGSIPGVPPIEGHKWVSPPFPRHLMALTHRHMDRSMTGVKSRGWMSGKVIVNLHSHPAESSHRGIHMADTIRTKRKKQKTGNNWLARQRRFAHALATKRNKKFAKKFERKPNPQYEQVVLPKVISDDASKENDDD